MQAIAEQLKFIEENYELRKNETAKRLVRHDFFSEFKTELQAYLYGILASDGCIVEKQYAIQLKINPTDSELFDYFRIISPDVYTHEYQGYTSNAEVRGRKVSNKGSVSMTIHSKLMHRQLIEHGLVPRKTYEQLSIPKKMPESLIRHFLRGYFDGDGCLTWCATPPRPSNREINWRVRSAFSIDSKTNNLLLEFQKFFAQHDIKVNLNYIKRDDMYRLSSASRKEITKIFHLLYDDSYFYLSRKFNKFNHYVNTEVTQLIAEHRNAQEMSVSDSNNSPKSVEHTTDSVKMYADPTDARIGIQ